MTAIWNIPKYVPYTVSLGIFNKSVLLTEAPTCFILINFRGKIISYISTDEICYLQLKSRTVIVLWTDMMPSNEAAVSTIASYIAKEAVMVA
jgi:hypothetical protein